VESIGCRPPYRQYTLFAQVRRGRLMREPRAIGLVEQNFRGTVSSRSGEGKVIGYGPTFASGSAARQHGVRSAGRYGPGALMAPPKHLDLEHRVTLELLAVVARLHLILLASKFSNEAPSNPGAPKKGG
jgi:hypothetical protein